MIKQIVSPNVGLAFILVFGFIFISGLQSTEALSGGSGQSMKNGIVVHGFNAK